MKFIKQSATILLLLLTCLGCNNDKVSPLLGGGWLWEGSSGGFAGQIIEPKPGERVMVKFESGNRFAVFRNDTLCQSGSYSISEAESIYNGQEVPRIRTKSILTHNDLKDMPVIVLSGVINRLSDGKLSIGDNMHDGYDSSFKRVN